MAEFKAQIEPPVWRFRAAKSGPNGTDAIEFTASDVDTTYTSGAPSDALLVLAQALEDAGWDLNTVTEVGVSETALLEPESVDYPAPTEPEPEPEDPIPDPPAPST